MPSNLASPKAQRNAYKATRFVIVSVIAGPVISVSAPQSSCSVSVLNPSELEAVARGDAWIWTWTGVVSHLR